MFAFTGRFAGCILHALGLKHVGKQPLLAAARPYLRASVGDQINLWDFFGVVVTLPIRPFWNDYSNIVARPAG
ncbi:hypothetical protein BLAT2472_140020 [Burkholderia latens]